MSYGHGVEQIKVYLVRTGQYIWGVGRIVKIEKDSPRRGQYKLITSGGVMNIYDEDDYVWIEIGAESQHSR